MSNFNGKQQLKLKYYVSTSQPDQIWASMGRKGNFLRALDKKWLKNSSFRAEIGRKKSRISTFQTNQKEWEFLSQGRAE